MSWISSFLTGISTPPNHQVHVISRRLCSGWLRHSSASAHVCSGLYHPSQISSTFNEGLEKAPFPSQGSQISSTAISQPMPARTHSQTVIPVYLSSMQGHFLASYFRVFDVVLCDLPGASYSINDYLPLAFTSFLSYLLSHLLTYPFTCPLTHPPFHLLRMFCSSRTQFRLFQKLLLPLGPVLSILFG
ncbi:uncharacterized protein K444DRAFT_175032 [Hyaloscypha bicolor E]|uniref:Uncharacterized protein n=1 Tax=Hyaloscypha bicolor E TaxID=1095630 RepID=A0A2J6TQE3_9HELO|nr:uncharacterized protein K444DRAFT_175032 [Hyaloscypha bicolor E]PMD65239.1 hypothetical protein K444DRAFT_175032 [Hyaloscypha bicolor E]